MCFSSSWNQIVVSEIGCTIFHFGSAYQDKCSRQHLLPIRAKLVRKSVIDSFPKDSVVQLVSVVNCVLYHFFLERYRSFTKYQEPHMLFSARQIIKIKFHNHESFGKLNFLSFWYFSIFFMMIPHMTQADHNHCDIKPLSWNIHSIKEQDYIIKGLYFNIL